MSGRLPRPKGMKAVKTKQVAKPYPCKLALNYDLSEGRFKATDYMMAYERS